MTGATPTYVLDTGPLSHFAKSQWLGVLKLVLKDTPVLIPDVVENELRTGTSRHHYRPWFSKPTGSSRAARHIRALESFAHYS